MSSVAGNLYISLELQKYLQFQFKFQSKAFPSVEISHAHVLASLLPKTIDNRSDCEDDVGFREVFRTLQNICYEVFCKNG